LMWVAWSNWVNVTFTNSEPVYTRSITCIAAISVGSGGHDSSPSIFSPGAVPSERSGSSTYSWISAVPSSKSNVG
jgi:hypothetical protein